MTERKATLITTGKAIKVIASKVRLGLWVNPKSSEYYKSEELNFIK